MEAKARAEQLVAAAAQEREWNEAKRFMAAEADRRQVLLEALHSVQPGSKVRPSDVALVA